MLYQLKFGLRLTKLGTGTLNLTSGSNNTYSGATYIYEGNHAIAHANGLGTTGGATTVYSVASLNISNNITVAEPITINGTGVSGGGAIRLTSGNGKTYYKIIVLADSDTWEEVNGEQSIIEISEESYEQLCNGETYIAELIREKKVFSNKVVSPY